MDKFEMAVYWLRGEMDRGRPCGRVHVTRRFGLNEYEARKAVKMALGTDEKRPRRRSAKAMRSVYVIAATDSGPCKIGVTGDVPKRLASLQVGSSVQLYVYHNEPGDLATERMAHAALTEKRMIGEWFDVSVEDAVKTIKTVAAIQRGTKGGKIDE